MNRSTALIVLGIAVALAGVGLAGCVSSPSSTTNDQGNPSASTTGSSKTVYVNITMGDREVANGTTFDAAMPANVTVPAGATVVFTITNQDPDPNPAAPEDAVVRGTLGNTMMVNGESVSQVVNTTVSHTFTIPGEPTDKLNIPVPAAKSDSQPTVVTFKVVFDQTGTYQWFCETPCDHYAMVTPGFMQGSIHVTA